MKRCTLGRWPPSQAGLQLRERLVPDTRCRAKRCAMAREAPIIRLSLDECQELQQLANARSTPQGLAFRARLILRCAQPGIPRNDHVAAELGCDADTVSRWRRRFRD